jgi:hypothetical protein
MAEGHGRWPTLLAILRSLRFEPSQLAQASTRLSPDDQLERESRSIRRDSRHGSLQFLLIALDPRPHVPTSPRPHVPTSPRSRIHEAPAHRIYWRSEANMSPHRSGYPMWDHFISSIMCCVNASAMPTEAAGRLLSCLSLRSNRFFRRNLRIVRTLTPGHGSSSPCVISQPTWNIRVTAGAVEGLRFAMN